MADLQAFIYALQVQQITSYVAAAGAALVVYDRVLTFSQEVDLIWNRQWSYMTALYFIARYSGDLLVIGCAAWNMCINWNLTDFQNMYLAITWADNIFILATQAILVIRVYALFNQSKKILIFLATCYVLQVTASFVVTSIVANKRALDNCYTSIGPPIGSVAQYVGENSSGCLLTVGNYGTLIPIIFDAVLLFFALWALVQHTLEAKKSYGGWPVNVLVRTLVADQWVYFVCFQFWLVLSVVIDHTSADWVDIMLAVFHAVVVLAGARMIISLRATESKTRGEGGTLEGEVSTIRFGIREPPAQSESVMEEGGGLRETDENAQID